VATRGRLVAAGFLDNGGPRVPRSRVSTRAVVAAAGKKQDAHQHDHDEGDDAERLHPAGHAGVRITGAALAGRGIVDLVSHVGAPSVARARFSDAAALSQEFTRQSVLSKITMPRVRSWRILRGVPKLWNDTIEAHRREVRDAIMDTTAALVAEAGLRSVTMSRIAEETGIGRATLYKYFSDVEAIVFAWHERQVTGHLAALAEVGTQGGAAIERLEAVLEAYAFIAHEYHGTQLAALVHRGEHVARAQHQLRDFVRDLLTEAADAGELRADVAPAELASYCLHALGAASSLPSKAAVRRLVKVILAGLRP
jgi:AcrR family transcriptional regulator